jgi:AcrR family transcriptional regulator
MALSRRDHLVHTALTLFCRQGFRATGIDAVLAESGVAKKTLYNHFKSKDELIIATLQKRDEDFFVGIRDAIERFTPQQQGDPRMARVLAFFDALDEWITSDSFNGCTFINASAEYPRRDDPIHVACANHKKLVVQFIQELLSGLRLEDSLSVARQVALLVDGAIVNAHTGGDLHAARQGKAVVERLLTS